MVTEAAEALGYTPNPAALSLLSKRTGGIGVLLPFLSGEFFSELLNGLDQGAQDHGLFLVVSTSHRRPDEFRNAIQFLSKRVDGLVVMAPELDARGTASILGTATPVVFVNTYAEGLSADVFNFDNFAGSRDLTRHLLDAGHRRIALLQGPPRSRDAQERARGYRAAMDEAGIEADGRLEFQGGYTREAGYAVAGEVARARPRPTALVAANDYCAMGAMSGLRDLGLSIPDEIAVGGFDGLTSGAYAVPPLTTVRVPIEEIGYRAVGRLAARLRGDHRGEPHQRHHVAVELLVRESTAPLAAAS